MNQEKIGKFIAKLRKEKKITQSELAEKLGVTDRSVSNWENGKNMPDLSLFKPLCEILGISINELMSGEKIDNKEYTKKLEENLITTIDYINKNNKNTNDIRSIFYLIIGIIGIVLSQIIFNDYEFQSYVTLISMVLSIYGIKQLFIKYKVVRKIVAILLLIICVSYIYIY